MIDADIFWAIHPLAANKFSQSFGAFMRQLQISGPKAGPAEEAARDGLPIAVTGGVAVIPVMGAMFRRAPSWARSYGITGTESIKQALQTALADDDVHSILLRVDSPGGSVSGIRELAQVIAAAEKPVIAQVEGMAASAAYFVASQADKILVGPGDLVGSIGVRIMLYDYSKAFEEAGIKAIPVDTGEFKSAGAMGTEITEAQLADFQRTVDYYYDDFVAAVSTGRSMKEQDVRDVGDGRMYSPEEAMSSGLVDGISTIEKTLNEMRSSAPKGRSTQTARARLRL